MQTLRARINNIPHDLLYFSIATFVAGMGGSLVDSVFNNFLNDTFSLTGFQRSFLEIPRELPGFIVVFVSALLWFLSSRKLGAFSLLLVSLGALLMGFLSKTYLVMVMFLFLYSLGQHLFMPVSSGVGMELAPAGKPGQRLGQMNAIRNLAIIAGSGLIFIGFKFLNFNYQTAFTLCAVCYLLGMAAMAFMHPSQAQKTKPKEFLKLRKEYSLYYVLAVLSGMRKQIFITFAPWVIVTVFGKPTQTIATLILIGGVIGILFQPILGKAIDKLGERTILSMEAFLLVFICLGYAFSKSLFSNDTAFIISCVCYLIDQVLLSVSMARATYMKKIALQESDVQPALSAAITIDHFFSITLALVGGIIWSKMGFQYVFLLGTIIAVVNFFVTRRIKIPVRSHSQPTISDPPAAAG